MGSQQRRVRILGHTVSVPDETSAEEIRTAAGLPRSDSGRMMVRFGQGGQHPTQVPTHGKFRVLDGDTFEDLPVGEYGWE